jgi:Lyzozyme M1 (1,4-beta-N-acetylmuramidase)
MTGADVSKWQGAIDWGEARAQIEFAMVKATQGVSEVDPDYQRNIDALRAAGERRGSYHYPDGGNAGAEALFYVEHAGRLNGEMQALDFEGAVLELPDPVGWAEAWLAVVIERAHNRPLIYMSGSTLTRFDWARVRALNVGLWVASWAPAPPEALGGWPFAIMWQRDDTGQLRGIAGAVDQDVFFGDAATWAAYANNIDTPAPPPPVTPPAPPPPPPAPAAADYTVRAGDTLSAIGARFGVTVEALCEANEHRYPSLNWNPNLIQIGWQLTLPGRYAAPAPAPAPVEQWHDVRPGDTLSGLAEQYHTTIAVLVALNAHSYPRLGEDPNYIQAGWRLRIS